ncbi:MAG: hypothetical protein ABI690_19375 [Chloroflexota bacterium]
MPVRFLGLLVFFLVGAACTSEATPFPVDTPTVASGQLSSDQSVIRYALAPNTDGLVSDINLLKNAAQVVQLDTAIDPADLGSQFDIAAGYGDIPGGTRSPVTLHIVLVINPTLLPWHDPNILNIFRRSFDPEKITNALDITGVSIESVTGKPTMDIQTQLANAGWPDGLSFNLGNAYAPGSEQIIAQWKTASIQAQQTIAPKSEIQADLIEGRFQAALVIWTTPDERGELVSQFGNENVIDLYSLPISYLAVPELHISFTPGGWPLPTR